MSRGELEPIDVPGAVFTVAAGINNDGAIVGQYRLSTDSPAIRRGFLFTGGQFIAVDPPGSLFTNVLGIGPGGCHRRPFLYDGRRSVHARLCHRSWVRVRRWRVHD